MAKTIDDEDYKRVSKFIDKNIEPNIKKIVESLNDYLKKDGIRVGVELKWFYDKVEKGNEVNETETKKSFWKNLNIFRKQ